jgi:hypothetical protein
MWTCRAAIASLPLLVAACGSKEAAPPRPQARVIDAGSPDALPAPSIPVDLYVKLRFQPREGDAIERGGHRSVTIPRFPDQGGPSRAPWLVVVPLELEGGLETCVAIAGFDAPDSVELAVYDRWDIRSEDTFSIQAETGTARIGGGPVQAPRHVLAGWKDCDCATNLMFGISAAPAGEDAPPAPLAPRSALDTCVAGLESRVITSLQDL